MSSSNTVPSIIWVELLGSTSGDAGTDVVITNDGGIYVFGMMSDGVSLLDGGQLPYGEAFVAKYSDSGSRLWAKSLGAGNQGSNLSAAAAQNGMIFVVGRTDQSIDSQTNNGNWDAYLIALSGNGAKVWTRLIGSPTSDDAYSVATHSDGSIYVVGETDGSFDGQIHSGGKDGFVTKFDAAGNKIWTRFIGSSAYDVIYGVAVSQDGSIYLGGSTQGNLDGQTFKGGMDGFLTKLSANGTKLWTRLIGGVSTDEVRGVALGPDGSIFVTGYTHNNLDGEINKGWGDIFVSKFTADGSRLWTRLLGSTKGEYANAIVVSTDGSIFVAGVAEGGSGGLGLNGTFDALIAKFECPSLGIGFESKGLFNH